MRLQLSTGADPHPVAPHPLWWRAAPLVLALCALGATSAAHADGASGTWTGSLEGRGNYYWERSTRVVVPSAEVVLEAPNGARIGADYLVDVISSASIAQTGSDEDAVHVELRHGFGGLIGKQFDFGGSQLDLTANARYSTEDDYKSLIFGFSASFTFNDKNTTLQLAASRVSDDIRSNADPTFAAELSGFTLKYGVDQVLNPAMTLSASYQFGYLEGYLGNAYRTVLIGPLPHREQPPDERFRHTGSVRIAFFIDETDTAVHVSTSGYADDWEILAITPELRVYQHFGQDFIVRPRYRFYAQTNASFQLDAYPAGYEGPTTNDPKMTEFTTHTLGASFEYRLGFLADGPLDFAKQTWLDLSFDRYWSTNAFGNGVIATAGGRIEF